MSDIIRDLWMDFLRALIVFLPLWGMLRGFFG